ncbi:hypothetical protein J7444_08240 [Labrenzia sp. R4_1]|uniref:hypothetical protein n=1 Tax=Labrenzia sp. R4_1 TaxID=2821106 RepID=UPI001AD9534E|nr:hypothetical protein [Labrenzia sp. R4_1]MBO9424707.1 hypothetical protein [Labrenzia sp. R4_1]
MIRYYTVTALFIFIAGNSAAAIEMTENKVIRNTDYKLLFTPSKNHFVKTCLIGPDVEVDFEVDQGPGRKRAYYTLKNPNTISEYVSCAEIAVIGGQEMKAKVDPTGGNSAALVSIDAALQP